MGVLGQLSHYEARMESPCSGGAFGRSFHSQKELRDYLAGSDGKSGALADLSVANLKVVIVCNVLVWVSRVCVPHVRLWTKKKSLSVLIVHHPCCFVVL